MLTLYNTNNKNTTLSHRYKFYVVLNALINLINTISKYKLTLSSNFFKNNK